MEIVRKPRAEEPIRKPFQPEPEKAPEEVEVKDVSPEQAQYRDIRMIDPNTGEPIRTELDQIDLPPAGDYLQGIYELLVWASSSIVALVKMTPGLMRLNPELEKNLDQFATIAYQVTDTGAQVVRGLWNWPFARVLINQQVERLLHPAEVEMFDRLYTEWYQLFIHPTETGVQPPGQEKLVEWLKSKRDEIADPEGFLRLCINRYRMERAAAESAWAPTKMLQLTRPGGGAERKTTTTGLERVFRRRPG